MLTRRTVMLAGLASVAAPGAAFAHHTGKAFKIDPKHEPQGVWYSGYPKGTIVVDPKNHFLYLVEGLGRARRYGVGVGQAGLTFKGSATIDHKAEWPRWTPTQNMIRRNPGRYAKYANGVAGGPNNPLGARALYLYRGGRDTYYRIHGTNQPSSIGRSVSAGCIRMINDHVIDLYERVPLGTAVVVI
ncbi:MAG: L,D-transpeptidase [Pseudomonadota bacterium]